MWPIFCFLFTARAQEPAATGALRIEVVDPDDSWAAVLWRRTLNRLEREWRRASRRSEDPVPRPTPPEPPAGLPVPNVELELSGEGVRRTALTDADGLFLFTELPPGQYQVSAAKPGFRGVTWSNLPVSAGETFAYQITLERQDEDIIVTWNRHSRDEAGSRPL